LANKFGGTRAGFVLWRFRTPALAGLSKFAAAEGLLLGEPPALEGRFGEVGFNDWEIRSEGGGRNFPAMLHNCENLCLGQAG
jgi:hypothetical protein